MAGKRSNKKLKRQQNNAAQRSKVVPHFRERTTGKHVPRSVTKSDSYRDEKVEWTMRDMGIDEHARDGRRWDLKAQELKKLFAFLEDVVTKTWREVESEGAGGHRRNHAHPVTDLSK